jgi:hypothetical protein
MRSTEKQEKERRQMYARMAGEVDRLRSSIRADALRICAAIELRGLGVYTDEYLYERDGLVFVCLPLALVIMQVNGQPDLEASIEKAVQSRLDDDAMLLRHKAEAIALQAAQVS